MLVIRLARIGRSRTPAFRIVVQEKTKAPKSDALEIIGSYDPLAKGENWKFDLERLKHWLSQGAQTSATIHNALVKQGALTGAKRKVVGRKKGELAKEKTAVEEASKAAAEAKKAEAEKVEAAKPAEATAAEAPKVAESASAPSPETAAEKSPETPAATSSEQK